MAPEAITPAARQGKTLIHVTGSRSFKVGLDFIDKSVACCC